MRVFWRKLISCIIIALSPPDLSCQVTTVKQPYNYIMALIELKFMFNINGLSPAH